MFNIPYYEVPTKPKAPSAPWNKGKIIGQKKPLKLNEIWAIRIRLEMTFRVRELAMFNLALDSKLRACDLVRLCVHDVMSGGEILKRSSITQKKTSRPVQFEITAPTRKSLEAWIKKEGLGYADYLFPSRAHLGDHISTRQYGRFVKEWVTMIGLPSSEYGTHSMRRTKASLVYRKTHNLRAVQLLLGHTKMESTVRYLGIEVDDALEMSEQTEI